jgi:hypothetical protein
MIMREEASNQAQSAIPQDELAANHELYVGPQTLDHDIDGLELSDAARTLGISIDEIWRRIRNGRLIARTLRGKVLVYTDMNEFLTHEGLPPPPISTNNSPLTTMTHFEHTPNQFPVVYGGQSSGQSQELALLIDHLSLAKDENREILKLTQDSMNRLTQMTDAIIEMKDAMLAAKDEQVTTLRQTLSNQAQELVRVLKEKEDLETLAQALQSK